MGSRCRSRSLRPGCQVSLGGVEEGEGGSLRIGSPGEEVGACSPGGIVACFVRHVMGVQYSERLLEELYSSHRLKQVTVQDGLLDDLIYACVGLHFIPAY